MTDSVPERLDLNLFKSLPHALPDEWGNSVGRHLLGLRQKLYPYAPEGTRRTRWIADDIEDLPGIYNLRETVNKLAKEAGLPQSDSWTIWAAAAHHRGGQDWFKYDESCKAAFQITLHTPEKLFEGGELEFWSGARVEPSHCTLTVWRPTASFRIRPVECWASGIVYSRWSIEGYL